MEPATFAAQLISRLERLKREQDGVSSERLQQIQEVGVRPPPRRRSLLLLVLVSG